MMRLLPTFNCARRSDFRCCATSVRDGELRNLQGRIRRAWTIQPYPIPTPSTGFDIGGDVMPVAVNLRGKLMEGAGDVQSI